MFNMFNSSISVYFRNYKFNSIFFKNFILILLSVLLPFLAFCVGGYLFFQRNYMEQIVQSNEKLVMRVSEMSDVVQINIETIGIHLASSNVILKFCELDKWDSLDYTTAQEINNAIKMLTLTTDTYIENIYIYSFKNEYIIGSNQLVTKSKYFNDGSWITQGDKVTTKTIGRVFENKPLITTFYPMPISVINPQSGTIAINMKCDWLSSIIGDEYEGRFTILDAHNTVLFATEKDLIGKPLSELDEYFNSSQSFVNTGKNIINKVQSEITGRQYISVLPLDNYYKQSMYLVLIMFTILLGSIVISIILSFYISKRLFKPIETIMEMLEHPENIYINYNENGKSNELSYIANTFLKSFNKTHEIEKELTHYITKLKNSQISLLQEQINPHFLFNTLQTVYFLCISLTNGNNKASESVRQLSTMLRSVLQVETNLVRINQEMDYCKLYIEIEQLRQDNGFDVVWQISEQFGGWKIVKLSLQPILENCIRHGFSNYNKRGVIIIIAEETNNEIEITIRDNGCGCDNALIECTNKEMEKNFIVNEDHIGLSNVNQRIKLIFGEQYGLMLLSNSLGGLDVKITIPKVR